MIGSDLSVGGVAPTLALTGGKADGSERVSFGLGGCGDANLVPSGFSGDGVSVVADANRVSGDMLLPVVAGWYSVCWSLNGLAGTYVGVGSVVSIGAWTALCLVLLTGIFCVLYFLCLFCVCGLFCRSPCVPA